MGFFAQLIRQGCVLLPPFFFSPVPFTRRHACSGTQRKQKIEASGQHQNKHPNAIGNRELGTRLTEAAGMVATHQNAVAAAVGC